MRPARVVGIVAFCGLALCAAWLNGKGRPRSLAELQWIWFNEGDPAISAPAESRHFRRAFTIKRGVDEANLDITADNGFLVWVNGVLVGRGDDWKRVYTFDVKKHLVQGKNVLAVQAHNTEGPAGLLVRLTYAASGQSRTSIVSDGSWKASRTAARGWQKSVFDDRKWPRVKVIGPYGKAGPWRDLAWGKGSSGRFTVPAGFRVEQAVKNPDPSDAFSLINLTFDNKGRLLLSRENGPILLCSKPNKDGVFESVQPYCTQVRNCQGMCWVKDALLLVGNGPQGTGLYRVRDTKGTDHTDQVELLHQFRGGMSEHGPHAILHGPDGLLYVVIGNHAGAHPDRLAANSPLTRWPTGQMGPDQGKPNTTEDVLLPRLNDARGHAANILAPGGTIWRMDLNGKNLSLVAAGFRNAYDAAFSPFGELFTFDSDMEWDENLPWYRAVRICHCPPGADFVWRTGAANTPDYYLDSLPPVYETGRGSPVGLEFYDHTAFPTRYRGACFMADWSLGRIYAVHFKRRGASYQAEVEKFCTGNPLNVTDCVVGPDGALYFAMGGRGSQGGVYRIVYPKKDTRPTPAAGRQPLSAWSRAAAQKDLDESIKKQGKEAVRKASLTRLFAATEPWQARVSVLTFMQDHDLTPDAKTLLALLGSEQPELRAHAVWLLGVNGYQEGREALVKALKDEDALVRRRSCEALIRAGLEPPVEALWPLLADRDRFVRTAARLVLQRIDPKKWADRLWKEEKDGVAWEGIIALCKVNKAGPCAEKLFTRLRGAVSPKDPQALLDYVRTVQMALIHTAPRPIWVQAIGERCYELFPHKDGRVNRQLALLLTGLRREKQLTQPVHTKLLKALLASKGDRQQQIHYFYCLRLLKDGWTPEQKKEILAWYDSTQTWTGGLSFTPFLENIFREILDVFTLDERKQLLATAEKTPLAALVLAQKLQEDGQPQLLPAVHALLTRLPRDNKLHRSNDLRQALTDALTRTALRHPSAETWPDLVRGLTARNKLLRVEALAALGKLPIRPKAEDPFPYRTLILAVPTFDSPRQKWQGIELLRRWNGRSFGAAKGKWLLELRLWSHWFVQTFPKEPPLPNVTTTTEIASRYKYGDLLTFLTRDPAGRKGDPVNGRKMFEKAQCLKCHKYGKEGEGIGPDLTTVSKRFKRADILESIYYPSKVISDQYRSVTITTTKGVQITGLAAPQGNKVAVLLSDASKVEIDKKDIDSQVASLISVMPEKLLDPLTRKEIADLFAFLESEPAK